MSSEAQIQANRENAMLSTGPKTDDGKAKSSLNAVKTGLTGRTVLLPSDDVAAYENHVAGFFKQFQPEGDQEHRLTQSLADTEWRLLRIPSLESGIYALGRIELAAEFASEPDPVTRAALIEAKIFRTSRRDLSNLSLQEGRLRRQREKDRAELETLQTARKTQYRQALDKAAHYALSAVKENWDLNLDKFGFEFEYDQVLERAAELVAKAQGDAYPQITKKWRLEELHKEFQEVYRDEHDEDGQEGERRAA